MRSVLIGAAAVATVAATAPGRAQRVAFDCATVRAYSSCAIGVGALAGRIVASALACGLPRERWTAVAAMMAAIINEVAVDEADREEGVAMISLSGEETLRRRQVSEDREPCDTIAQTFDELARELGVP